MSELTDSQSNRTIPAIYHAEKLQALFACLAKQQVKALEKIYLDSDILPRNTQNIAEFLNVHRVTWFRWCKQPAFVEALQELRKLRGIGPLGLFVENVIFSETLHNNKKHELSADLLGLRQGRTGSSAGNDKQIDYGETS